MSKARVFALVCDGGRSEIYVGEGRALQLAPVPGTRQINEALQALPKGERSTGYSSASSARYSVVEHGDPQRATEEAFVTGQLVWLKEHVEDFDRLVIVAPATALGALRKAMPAPLSRKLAGEVVADLTKSDTAAIAQHVAEALEAGRA